VPESNIASPPSRSSSLYLGIDLGTSGVRAVLIDDTDQVVAEAAVVLPAPQQQGNCVEQDPRHWWSAVVQVMSALRQQTALDRIRAIAVDGTSGTVLLADAHGIPLGLALMYNDTRAGDPSPQLARIAPTDSPVHSASSGLAKLLWLARQPGASDACYFLHQADWVASQLTGRPGFSDPNNALKSGYDPVEKRWPAWLEALPISPAWLPKVQPAGHPLGTVAVRIAAQFGLPRNAMIVTGTTDSTASFIATGASKTGEAVTALGSTLVLKVISDTPICDQRYGIYSQPLNDKWLVGGASNSGGAVLRQFFTDTQMAEMETRLDPDTPTGLNYYPLCCQGERFPVNDAHYPPRLSPRPENDARFFQGLLEGIATIERLGYERLQECGAPWPINVRTTGGGARNTAWTRLRGRMLNVPLLTASHTQAAFGAARLARQGSTTRNAT
jgi:D-ribulokinase